MPRNQNVYLVLSAVLTLCFFALNSLLCRMALADGSIDEVSFTTIRIGGASVVLALLVFIKRGQFISLRGDWRAAVALFTYAFCFSYSYTKITTGAGALILFGSVQITMVAAALISSESLGWKKIFGTLFAFSGIVYLTLPGLHAPPPLAGALMAISGIGWGCYSLLGRKQSDPLVSTAANFVKCVPLATLTSFATASSMHLKVPGVTYALLSGAITSGLGYALWYSILPRMTRASAALIQLAVPVLAAVGGVVVLGEVVPIRILIAFVFVLGGIAFGLLPIESKAILLRDRT